MNMLRAVNKVPGMPKHAALAMASGRMPPTDLEGNLSKPKLPGARGGMMARLRARAMSKRILVPKAPGAGGKMGCGQTSYPE